MSEIPKQFYDNNGRNIVVGVINDNGEDILVYRRFQKYWKWEAMMLRVFLDMWAKKAYRSKPFFKWIYPEDPLKFPYKEWID